MRRGSFPLGPQWPGRACRGFVPRVRPMRVRPLLHCPHLAGPSCHSRATRPVHSPAFDSFHRPITVDDLESIEPDLHPPSPHNSPHPLNGHRPSSFLSPPPLPLNLPPPPPLPLLPHRRHHLPAVHRLPIPLRPHLRRRRHRPHQRPPRPLRRPPPHSPLLPPSTAPRHPLQPLAPRHLCAAGLARPPPPLPRPSQLHRRGRRRAARPRQPAHHPPDPHRPLLPLPPLPISHLHSLTPTPHPPSPPLRLPWRVHPARLPARQAGPDPGRGAGRPADLAHRGAALTRPPAALRLPLLPLSHLAHVPHLPPRARRGGAGLQ